MKLSLNWLNDYVDVTDIHVSELVDRLTLSTCEVEGVEDTFVHLEQIKVARVEGLEKHPNADRLSVCQVDIGKQDNLQIVCGAPNVRAGMLVPLAPLGTELTLPDSSTLTIKAAKLRGVESNGMLCSPAELGLEKIVGEVDGLLDLEAVALLEKTPSVGESLDELFSLRDTIIDIDNKSITHRPDLWCHFGFAREIAAIFKRKIKFDPLSAQTRKVKTDTQLPKKKIAIEKGAVLAYYGAHLSNIQVRPAPLWMQARLTNVGQRPINNIVDASNYTMLELGQPNHTFDARELHSDTIGVALNGGALTLQKYTTLDGEERSIPRGAILITDGAPGKNAKPVALGGIMGGSGSEVANDTTALFLESATFPREKIRLALSKIGLRTDSAQRFEKGQDPAKAKPAIERLAALIAETCPKAKLGKITGENPVKATRARIKVTQSFLRARLGFEIKTADLKDILTRLNFEVKRDEKSKDALHITAPTYRSQYDISIPEDIVEELGRIHGYDNIAPVAPAAPILSFDANREKDLEHSLRRFLVHRGCTESLNYSFASSADNNLVRKDRHAVLLQNPAIMERPELRVAVAPGLLRHLALNQDRFESARLFELGRVYAKHDATSKAAQSDSLIRALPTPVDERKAIGLAWLLPGSDKKSEHPDDRDSFAAFLDFREEIESMLSVCSRISKVEVRGIEDPAATQALFHPRCAISWTTKRGLTLGHAGILHPGLHQHFDLKRPVLVAEFDFDAIYSASESDRKELQYEPPSVYPDSHFEVSLVLPEDGGTQGPLQIIEAMGIKDIREITLLSVYRGSPLPEGKKSASYRIRCGRSDGTMTGEEVQQTIDRVVGELGAAGFPLRS